MNITKEQIKEWLLSRSTPENEILPLMVDVIHDCAKDLSPKYMFDSLEDYEESIGYKVKPEVAIGFRMGRLKLPKDLSMLDATT